MIQFKCPECGVFAKFKKVGPYRASCGNCEAVVKNTELLVKREVYP